MYRKPANPVSRRRWNCHAFFPMSIPNKFILTCGHQWIWARAFCVAGALFCDGCKISFFDPHKFRRVRPLPPPCWGGVGWGRGIGVAGFRHQIVKRCMAGVAVAPDLACQRGVDCQLGTLPQGEPLRQHFRWQARGILVFFDVFFFSWFMVVRIFSSLNGTFILRGGCCVSR